MTISPDDVHLLIVAIVTFLGILGLFLQQQMNQAKQQVNHAETMAATRDTNTKVEAATAIINGQAAHVQAAANALTIAAGIASAQNVATQNAANQNATAPAPVPIIRPGDPS